MTLNLDGLMVAQVTPFTRNGAELDLDWLAGHLEWLRGFGIDGVLTLGTNGEGPSVGLDERRRRGESEHHGQRSARHGFPSGLVVIGPRPRQAGGSSSASSSAGCTARAPARSYTWCRHDTPAPTSRSFGPRARAAGSSRRSPMRRDRSKCSRA